MVKTAGVVVRKALASAGYAKMNVLTCSEVSILGKPSHEITPTIQDSLDLFCGIYFRKPL